MVSKTAPTAAITTASCGGSLLASTLIIGLTGATTNTTGGSVAWNASAGTVVTNIGTLAAPAATYIVTDLDRARGYVDFTLQANSAGGCDATATCRIALTGAAYDFGDLPATYDLSQTGTPYVAAALNPSITLRLGALNSDNETAPQPTINADGDNANGTNDEDGVASFSPITFATTSYSVSVTATNVSANDATLIGWIDWNNDGQFSPSEASAPITLLPGSINQAYLVSWSGITPTLGMRGYARFRISSSLTVYDYVGVSEGGEVEDYRILAVPLPVKLISFDGKVNNCGATLSWQTATEQSSDRYEVEHSIDGKRFALAGTVKSANRSTGSSYAFTYPDMNEGTHQFRLKIVDINGSFTYSNVISLHSDCSSSAVSVWPNPAGAVVNVNGLQGNSQVQLLNIEGQLLKEVHTASASVGIDMANFASGVYVIRVKDGNGKITNVLVTKK